VGKEKIIIAIPKKQKWMEKHPDLPILTLWYLFSAQLDI
jgi:hypothetical protein